MCRRIWLIAAAVLLCANASFAKGIEWDKIKDNLKDSVDFQKDQATIEAEYLKRVEKDRIKEEYGRKIMDRKPSGFMTMEEYELLSQPKDKAIIDYGVPQVNKPYDMQYVPQPTYKLARYNDPPGSPNLTISRDLYKTRQLNLPGITAPDFSIMVYPAVYYYPVSESVTCDLFMVALRDNDSAVNKILKANIANRYPVPILSTDKEITNSTAFRTLTPIDFSSDSKKLLVKEKIGSSEDGIWQTKAIVYDFSTHTSYDLVELRYAIEYYWKEYKGLNLEDKRWDLFPLGFSKGNPDRIIATAYAYTGDTPIFLGVWTIDYKGEQSRLISLKNGSIEVSSNGFKIVKDGVIPNTLVKSQEKIEKKYVKDEIKREKEKDKNEVKQMKTEMKEKLKEVDQQFKLEKEDYKLMDKLEGSTTQNENVEKYNELQEQLNEKRQIQAQRERAKQEAKANKAKAREEAKKAKQAAKEAAKQGKVPPQESTQPQAQTQPQTRNGN